MDIIDFKDGHATPKFWVLVNFIHHKYWFMDILWHISLNLSPSLSNILMSITEHIVQTHTLTTVN